MLGIRYINNSTGLGHVFMRRTLITRLAVFLYSFALAKSACVFFQNPDDLGLFADLGIVKGVQTGLLPGSGVDLDYFRCPQTGTKECRELNEITSFIFVSRMLNEKGFSNFMKLPACCGTGMPANFSL